MEEVLLLLLEPPHAAKAKTAAKAAAGEVRVRKFTRPTVPVRADGRRQVRKCPLRPRSPRRQRPDRPIRIPLSR